MTRKCTISDYFHFSAMLRHQRKQLGLSQPKLSAVVEKNLPSNITRGLSVRTICSIENAEHQPTMVLLELIHQLGGQIVFFQPKTSKTEEQ